MSAALRPVEVFCSYVHEDEDWLRKLETHLSLLQRQGLLSLWHDRLISPGTDWAQAIDTRLERASVILLLVSADFFASDYCYGVELKRALERQEVGEALVIPILVRPVDWTNAPFAHLQVLPTNAIPITMWPDADLAFTSITTGIRQALEGLPLSASSNSPVIFPAIETISHPHNPIFPGRERELIEAQHTWANAISAQGPQSYIPFPRDPLFQPRPGEFERLESLLLGKEHALRPARVSLVGVAGMGGVGKTRLAVEIAYRFLDQQRFLGGIFWTPAFGTSRAEWQHHLAELAFQSGYLPPEDNISHPENEARRARHLARYLASHADALLILDNVDDPMLINTFLPTFAGKELACALLYTSRVTQAPANVTIHYVESLPEPEALRLLLQTTRPGLLEEALTNSQGGEVGAARHICKIVGYLPLALVHLRSFLTRDRQVSLVRLNEVLEARGILSIAKVLTTTFQLSWKQVQSEEARRLFFLAAYFPEAAPVPLWLLGLVAGLGEESDIFEPLGQARQHLQELSLLEELSDQQVRLHPLVRAFAQHLLHQEREKDRVLRIRAGQRLIETFCDLTRLELGARRIGYMACLEQVRIARDYAISLGSSHADQLIRLERLLDQESYLLANNRWWPEMFPALFYQQLSNRVAETDAPFPSRQSPLCWIHQIGSAGATNQALLRIFSGHTSAVWSAALSPNGRLALTGSRDQTARLWECSTGQLCAILQGHTDAVTSVAFSPDGRLALTGSLDQTARLWDTSSSELHAILQGHTGEVWSVAFSPDGRLALTGSTDQTARLWDTSSGGLHAILAGHVDRVTSIAFSPDGRLVLTGSDDRTARLWDSNTGQLYAVLQGHIDKVNVVAFSPDGRLVLTGSNDQTVRLWDTSSGELHAILAGHANIVLSAAFSPDGRLVLTGSDDQTARLWHTSSGELHAVLRGHIGLVRRVMFSPDGQLAFTGDTVGMARLWESNTGQLHSILQGHAGHVEGVAFSPDGKVVLTASTDQTARLWDTTTRQSYTAVQGHTHYVNSVAFSPDGQRVLSGSSDRTARLWNSSTGELHVMLWGHTSRVTSVAFSPDGQLVLTGSSDQTARLWNSSTGELCAILQGHTDQVSSVAFSPDGRLTLTGSLDQTARLWDSGTGGLHAVLQGHTQLVECVAFSPDGRLALTGSWDQTARLWDSSTGELRAILQGHASQVSSVAFSPNGQLVLTGSFDRTARLWDSGTGELRTILQGHTDRVRFVAFSPDGQLALTSDLRGWTFFWQLQQADRPQCLGLYIIADTISSLFWQDRTHLLFTDHSGGSGRPFIYRVHLEGPCWYKNIRNS